ncbi:mitogen-activated protein kinase-binding protein 1 isoform X2 [Telopea speciosissima]|uniref:mitogen-activated protein kinase-binding protein 1 isoform X2 n=1 Tax=Telopea speciosissima TaxID=54955 RepID=UPI001CC6E1F8|nr:mitogen-activated protein kinase-binding protein 1 isoform X2 [Telopea speciosissima]
MKPNRKRKRSDTTPMLALEEIIGLTTKNSNGLASNCSTGDCIYLAGCVVVIYNVDSRTQSHLLVSARTPKALSCVAVSQDGRYIASGESGHQPAVLIWDYSTQALISELKGHQYGVASIAFSPNGKHMVSAGFPRDGYLCLWDWRSGALVAKLKASSSCSTIASVCFSSDAKCFVTAGKKHLKFWKVGCTNIRANLLPLDGKLAILGCQRGSSIVSVTSPTWTANNLVGSDRAGKFCPIYALTDAGVLCLLHSGLSINKWVDLKVQKGFALTVSNKLIACACSNGVVQLLTVDTLKHAGSLQYADVKECREATDMGYHTKYSDKGFQHSSAFPDAIACQFSTSEKLVVVFADRSLYVWEIHDGYKVCQCYVLASHSACIWDVQNLPCENRHDSVVSCRGCSGRVSFATCSADGTIRFWHFTSQPNSVKKEEDGDLSVDQQIGGNSLKAGSVRAIRLESGGIFECDIVIDVGSRGFRSMAVSSDGKYLVAGDFLGNLHIYNLLDSDYKCFQEAHNAEILSLSFSLSGKNTFISEQEASKNLYLLASAGRDRVIHLYDVNRGFDLIESLDDHSAAVTSVKFTFDGRKILSCSADRSVVFRDVSVENTGCKISRRHHQIASQGTIYDMAIDPAMEVAVTVGQDKKINTFNITAGKLVRTFKQQGDFGEPIKVNIDPSSSYMVCLYSNRSICIYDFTSGELIAKAVGHGEVITGVIFLPDCKHIISVGGDGCIFLWKIPALLSSKIFHRMKELADSKSAISMDNPLTSNESTLHDSKHTCILEKSVQAVQKSLFQEGNTDKISAFKFSISRLPKWAQAKLINKETVPADPQPTPTQCLQVDMGSWSSIVDNGGTSVSTCPMVQRPCQRDLGGTDICFTDVSKTSFGTHTSQSSPMSNEIPSFTMGNRWLTIHTVCFDPLDSPEERDLKDAMLPAPVPKSLQDPAVERVQNSDSMEIALGAPVVRRDLLVEPPYETSNRLVNDSQVLSLSESTSSAVDNLCKKEGQLGIHKTEARSEAVARDKQLHSCADEIMANATVKEKTDSMYRGNDLFNQHFGNLSTAVKLAGRKSSASRSYSGRFIVRNDHLMGCKKLFHTPSQNLGAESLNKWDKVAPHSSSRGPLNQGLGELSDACDEGVKNATGSLVNPACVIQRSDSTSSVKDNLMNMERAREKYQMEGIPRITEVQEIITGCNKALLSLNDAAQCALQLFSKLEILLSGQDAIAGAKTKFYTQAAELVPSIKEKVNALADLVQSDRRNSCSNNGAEPSGFEPI